MSYSEPRTIIEMNAEINTTIPLSSDTHYFDAKPNSNKLLIVLSATGTKTGRFNLWSLRDQIPHNILFLRVPTNDWYQSGIPGISDSHDGTIAAIKSLAEAHDITSMYTCGSSMGAYGALLYGTSLNCNVLAFNPEIELKLPSSRSTKMMPKGAPVNFPDIRSSMKDSSAVFHIYTGERDPVDLYCADSVKDFENVRVVTFPADEHTVLRTFVSSNRFLALIWSFMSGSDSLKLSDTGRAMSYDKFAYNFYHGWLAYQNKDNGKCRQFLELALAEYPASSYSQYMMGNILYRLNNYEKGKDHILFALALEPNIPAHHVSLAYYFRQVGLLEEAVKTHLEIQKRWPESYQSKYELAMVYLALGKKSQAIAQLEAVIKLKPDRQNYKNALAKIQ